MKGESVNHFEILPDNFETMSLEDQMDCIDDAIAELGECFFWMGVEGE